MTPVVFILWILQVFVPFGEGILIFVILTFRKTQFLKRGRCRIGFNSQKGVQNDIKATRSHQRRNDEELTCGVSRSSNCVIDFMGAGSERQSDVKMVEAMRGEESRAINLSLTILNEVRIHLQ